MTNLDSVSWQVCKDFGLAPNQQEFIKKLIRPLFEIRQRELYQRELRLNEQLKEILKGEGLI